MAMTSRRWALAACDTISASSSFCLLDNTKQQFQSDVNSECLFYPRRGPGQPNLPLFGVLEAAGRGDHAAVDMARKGSENVVYFLAFSRRFQRISGTNAAQERVK